MVKLTIRNESQWRFKVQEGNTGIFVTRAVLKHNGTYVLVLDPNATYRQYYFTRLPDQTQLPPLSSDDVLDFSEVILRDTTWEGIPRRPTTKADAKPQPQPQPPPPPQPSKFIKFFKLLWNGNTSLT